MTYAEKLKDPRWQKKRLKILERDKWECQLCFCTTRTLHVHHKKYHGEPYEAKDKDLTTYCDICHFVVESWKKSNLSTDCLVISYIETSAGYGYIASFMQVVLLGTIGKNNAWHTVNLEIPRGKNLEKFVEIISDLQGG